jgi:hypothetical protein
LSKLKAVVCKGPKMLGWKVADAASVAAVPAVLLLSPKGPFGKLLGSAVAVGLVVSHRAKYEDAKMDFAVEWYKRKPATEKPRS